VPARAPRWPVGAVLRIETRIRASSYSTRTIARAPGACLRTLVSASRTMRYAVRLTTGEASAGSPTSTSSAGLPTAVDSATSTAKSEAEGDSSPSGSVRRMPTRSRSSSSAWQPAARSSSADRRVGSSGAVNCSAPACSTIRLTRCVTMSCISPASRARSSARACPASRCRSRSARSARSVSACTSLRRASKYSASSGPSATRRIAIAMIAIDGCHGRATMTVSRAIAMIAVRWFPRVRPHSSGAYAASVVPKGAHTFPSCAGVSTPAGEISSVTARVNADRMPITAYGARRRAASEEQAAACRPSRTQASVPGCAGHHELPASVAPVSSSTKKTAIAMSTATRCRQYQRPTFTPLTVCQLRPRSLRSKPSAGRKPTKVARRPAGPVLRRATTRLAALPPGIPAALQWDACRRSQNTQQQRPS